MSKFVDNIINSVVTTISNFIITVVSEQIPWTKVTDTQLSQASDLFL